MQSSLSFLKNGIKLFISSLFLSSAVVNAQNTATITGTIINPKSTSVVLTTDKLHLDKTIESVTSIVKDGQFQFTANLDGSELIELTSEDFHQVFFIEPGDNLQLQVKENKVTLSGKGSEQNIFLQKFDDQFKNDFDDIVMQPKISSTGVDAFEMLIFGNRKKQNDFFKKADDKEKFSPAFNQFIQNNINYRYWNLLFSYPITNANNNTGLTVTPLPAVMLDHFSQVRVNNDSALLCESYREFLKYYIVYYTSEANGFNKFTDLSTSADRKFAIAKDRLKDRAFKFWLAKFTMDECPRLSPFLTKKLVSELKDVDKEGLYAPVVSNACKDKIGAKDEVKKEEKAPGNEIAPSQSKKADELDLTDVNGKHVSLSDFKGKVVYIDFWASWCGPCRRMIPYSQQMHEYLSDKQKKQIVFLYISIDADGNAWKKGIQDLGIQGVNVTSPGNWGSKVCGYFQINSIPRYMIMNKQGDIVDFNAKRPADPSVLDDLMKYVNE